MRSARRLAPAIPSMREVPQPGANSAWEKQECVRAPIIRVPVDAGEGASSPACVVMRVCVPLPVLSRCTPCAEIVVPKLTDLVCDEESTPERQPAGGRTTIWQGTRPACADDKLGRGHPNPSPAQAPASGRGNRGAAAAATSDAAAGTTAGDVLSNRAGRWQSTHTPPRFRSWLLSVIRGDESGAHAG